MLLDSNIVIYSTQPEFQSLRDLVTEYSPAVSVVSYIEVLGYHRLGSEDRKILYEFFEAAHILPLTDRVADFAVKLRQQRSMSLGDSIVAATALVHDLTLVTHNTKDFRWIASLKIYDPISAD